MEGFEIFHRGLLVKVKPGIAHSQKVVANDLEDGCLHLLEEVNFTLFGKDRHVRFGQLLMSKQDESAICCHTKLREEKFNLFLNYLDADFVLLLLHIIGK